MVCRRNSRLGSLRWTVVPCGIFLAGCGVHLYNPGNHELATKAKESFANARIAETVVEERRRGESLLEREIEAVRRLSLADRDATIQSYVLRDSVVGGMRRLRSDAVVRAEVIGGVDLAATPHAGSMLHAHAEALRKRREQVGIRASELLLVGGWPARDTIGCPLAVPKDLRTTLLLDAAIEGVQQACQEVTRAERELAGSIGAGSELSVTAHRIAEIHQERTTLAQLVQKKREAYESEKKKYDELAKAGSIAELDAQGVQVRKALAAIGKVTCADPDEAPGDAQSGAAGGAAVAQEEDGAEKEACKPAPFVEKLADLGIVGAGSQAGLAELEELRSLLLSHVDALIASKGATDAKVESPVDAKLVATLSRFRELYAAANFPPINALLLELERLQIEIDRARRAVARAETLLRLQEARFAAQIAELANLDVAHGAADNAISACGAASFAAFSRAAPGCRRVAATALIGAATAWSVGRTVTSEIDFLELGVAQRAALDASELALVEWQKLIEIPLAQLEVYHATGIRAQDIGNLIQALGFSAVASGVH